VTAFSDRIKEFADLNAEVLGVSLDTVFVHKAWIQTPRDKNGVGEIKYPLGSDSTQQVARDYGVLIEAEGLAARGLFIIDPNGMLQYQVVHSLNIGRSVDEVLRVLEALQAGGLCPSDWRPGQKLLGG
jgi:peroxiredoxin (alkyl hydroperoxide reductase subunit C)